MIKTSEKLQKKLEALPSFDDFQISKMKKNPKLLKTFLRVSLEEYAQTKDLEELKYALGIVVRALGASKVSRKIKVDRSGLYKAFSPKGRPSFDTVCGVLDMAGFTLSIRAAHISK